MVRDTVCGMQVDKQQTRYALEYQGRMYYFCSEGCQREFQRHPEDYADKTPKP